MPKGLVTQAVVVSEGALTKRSSALQLALFKSDGTPLHLDQGVAVFQAASTAADVATLKTDFNALLTKLQTAGLMASS